MAEFWSTLAGTPVGPDYWEYFGVRFAELAALGAGADVLDVGCGTGASLFPEAEKVGWDGNVIGIDICPH